MYRGKGVEIDVDGAWLKEGRVGYGVVIRQEGAEVHREGGLVPEDPDLVEHRQIGGEIWAVVQAVRWCLHHNVKACTIYHDYEGLSAWAEGRWRAKTPLTQRYAAFIKKAQARLAITWVKVPAHCGLHWNEIADRLAKGEAP